MKKWRVEWQTNGKAAETSYIKDMYIIHLIDMREKITMIDSCQIAFMHYLHVPVSPNHTYHSERGKGTEIKPHPNQPHL